MTKSPCRSFRSRITTLRRGNQRERAYCLTVECSSRHCRLPHHSVPRDRDPDQFAIGSIAGSNCIAPTTIACAFSFRHIFKRRCNVRGN